MFNVCNFLTFKAYFQCLIHIEVLRQQGLTTLSAKQKPLYYKCLLQASQPATVLLNKVESYYKSLLSGAASAAVEDDASDGSDTVMSSCLMPDFKRPRLATVATSRAPSFKISAGEVSNAIDVTNPCRETVSDAGMEHASADAPVMEDTDAAMDMPMCSESAEQEYVALASGFQISVDSHLEPGQPGHYRRLLIKCPLAGCGHVSAKLCQKYRSLSHGNMMNFGHREPEAFLIAWAEAAHRFTDRAAHMQHRPHVHAVQAVIQRLCP